MYDELVKRLRICPDYNEGCVNCLHKHDLGCRTTTMHEAADAIEDLIEDNAALNGTVSNLIQQIAELSKPRWIPVTERLPIGGDRVICFGDNGINIVDFVCGDKWCALPWFYLDGEQETGVTHWMPLPEPPKEE